MTLLLMGARGVMKLDNRKETVWIAAITTMTERKTPDIWTDESARVCFLIGSMAGSQNNG